MQRPKISVCMASYRGERFIAEQIASILPQLVEGDELIIVDDHSTDHTVAIIQRFDDPRIRLIQQQENHGVVRTFEAALRLATGDIVFMADQDDIWPANKVERFLETFRDHPDVVLAISNTTLIDEHGNDLPIRGNWAFRSGFRPGIFNNLVRNLYMGCRMAFRAEVLDWCLPFPAGIPNFDSWIGMATELYGKVMHIPEPLLLHRRHGNNDSPETSGPLLKMIRDRTNLSKALIGLALKGKVRKR